MESFSEDEFLWTDTSKDSISTVDNLEETVALDHKSTRTKYSVNKNKMHRQPVKSEPESDCDTVLKKKKKKKHHENSEHLNDTSYDESFLDMKVKEEGIQSTSYNEIKKKSKKHKKENNGNHTTDEQSINIGLSHENINLKQESESELQVTKSKKKKKKSKISACDAKTEYTETVKQHITHEKREKSELSNNKLEHSMDWDSNEENIDEISAIKGDEDHNLNTIFFDDKTIVGNDKYDKEIKESPAYVERYKNTNGTNIDTPTEPKIQSSRKPRISDRIRFEDDDDNDTANEFNQVTENDNIRQSSKVKRFIKQNSHLKFITPNSQDGAFFSQNDDLWIIRCPKDVDVNDMNGFFINLDGKSKIKIGGQTYDCNTEDEKVATITVMNMQKNKFHIQNLPVTGMVQIRRRIPKPHVFQDNVMANNQTNFIPLPEIKCRHPLFGSNYKRAIKIPKAIAERLNTIKLESNEIHVSKKKKKKSCANKTLEKDELVDTTFEQEVAVKKKRKRKLTEKDSQDQSHKKAKRIKHDPESSEAWASEKAIEENLFSY